MKDKRDVINAVSSISGYIVGFAISFFLSPFIIKNVGKEAYGFYSLAITLMMYLNYFTSSLNMMGSRFVAVAYFSGDKKKTTEYFSSIFWSNIFIIGIMFIPAILLISNVGVLLNISPELLGDVKIILGVLFGATCVDLISTNLYIPFYLNNKIYIDSLGGIVANIVQGMVIVVFFALFPARITYIAVGRICWSIVLVLIRLIYFITSNTGLCFSITGFSKQHSIRLVKASVYNSVSSLSLVLVDGINYVVINRAYGPEIMGIYAIAKLIPACIISVINALVGAMRPKLTMTLTQKSRKELAFEVHSLMKVIIVVGVTVSTGVFTLSSHFYSLWAPEQNSIELSMWTNYIMIPVFAVLPAFCYYSVLVILNELKEYAKSIFIFICLDLIGIMVALVMNNNNPLIIVLLTEAMETIRLGIIITKVLAKKLHEQASGFARYIIEYIVLVVVFCAIFSCVEKHLYIDSWALFFVDALLIGGSSILLVWIIVEKALSKK